MICSALVNDDSHRPPPRKPHPSLGWDVFAPVKIHACADFKHGKNAATNDALRILGEYARGAFDCGRDVHSLFSAAHAIRENHVQEFRVVEGES